MLPEYNTDTPQIVPFRDEYARITTPATDVTTDLNGNYSFSLTAGTYSLTSSLEGPWIKVINALGGSASYSKSISAPSTHNIGWNTSGDAIAGTAEMNAFYHVNFIHNYVKNTLLYDGMDFQMPTTVNVKDYANAYYSSEPKMVFGDGGGSFQNFALFSDVVYHEYTHGTTHSIYDAGGVDLPYYGESGAIDEGLADYFGCSINGDSMMGDGGLYLDGREYMRNLDNTLKYPADLEGEVHADGRIIGGVFWDLRKNLTASYGEVEGKALADELIHFARFGAPITFEEYEGEILIADDDNADVFDGTPHKKQILDAFAKHGVSPLYDLLKMTDYSCVETEGNGDGFFDQAETGEIVVTLKAFSQNMYGVTAVLSSSDPYVTVDSTAADYGNILKGESKDNSASPFKFEIAEDCPAKHQIQFTALINGTSGYSKQLDISIGLLSMNRQITTDPSDQFNPAISGNYIVWQDKRNSLVMWDSDIYAYDLSTNTEQRITSNPYAQVSPAISGNYIVYEDFLKALDAFHSNVDIYAYDLSTNTEQQITINPSDQFSPDISGNYIVWSDYRNNTTPTYTNSDIYAYDLSTNTERRITTDPKVQDYPAISENYIVWEDYRNSVGDPNGKDYKDYRRNTDIYMYDLSTNTERQITTDPSDQFNPAISGNYIVWQDYRNGNSDIYAYDLSTNTERQITTDPSDQFNPAISGNYIVWQDWCNGNWDIYLSVCDLTPPDSPTVTDEGDSTFSTTTLSASWKSSDPESGIAEYRYRITQDSPQGALIKKGWTTTDSITVSDLNLERGKSYYFTVRAKNNVGMWSKAGYSDGIRVKGDTTPPKTPLVTDDGDSTDSTTTLSASWTSFDPESGIAEYKYHITQGSPQGELINGGEGWTTADSITVKDLELKEGESYYFTVIATNGAGLQSEAGYSDGISVRDGDTTPPTGTININSGDVYTSSASVTLTLSATDAGSGMGTGAQMQFSNDNSVWSTPETYTTSKSSWPLTTGDGTKTVYAKFKDLAGNWTTVKIKDDIIVDQTAPTCSSFKINNDAAYTNSGSVTLNITATDAGSGMGTGAQMKISNTNPADWSTIGAVDYSSIPYSWTLTTGNGINTVYVKFKDAAGNWTTAVIKDDIIVDITPPAAPALTSAPYTSSLKQIAVSWTANDLESNIAGYQYAIGKTSGATDLTAGWISTGITASATKDFSLAPLKQGATCYFSIKAKNGAEIWSAIATYPIKVDTTSPTGGAPTVTDGGVYTTNANQLTASWTQPCKDSESGIAWYEYRITKDSASGTVIQDWTPNAMAVSVTKDFSSALLTNGIKYYFSVRAVNGAGLPGTAGSSSGIKVDITAPTTPVVTDDGNYTTSTIRLHASWTASDPESNIVKYEYAIGTSKGALDVVNWTPISTAASVTRTGLSLLRGNTYYFSVKAFNGAGKWSVGYSDGIKVQ